MILRCLREKILGIENLIPWSYNKKATDETPAKSKENTIRPM